MLRQAVGQGVKTQRGFVSTCMQFCISSKIVPSTLTYLQEGEVAGFVLAEHLGLGVAKHGDEGLRAEYGVPARRRPVQNDEASV